MPAGEEGTRRPSGLPDRNAVWVAMQWRPQVTPGSLSGPEFVARPGNAECDQRPVEGRHRGSAERRLASMAIPDGATVLEIGAGPGMLAVPLAVRGCRVTAVGPPPPMRRALQAYADRMGVTVAVLEQPWEEADPSVPGGLLDAVVTSYPPLMPDLRAALPKMRAVCRGRPHRFHPLTPPGGRAVERARWPVIHGADDPSGPMAGCVWHLLFRLEFRATLAAGFPPAVHRFGDPVEAVAESRDPLNGPRDGDGAYRLDRPSGIAFIPPDMRGPPFNEGCKAYA